MIHTVPESSPASADRLERGARRRSGLAARAGMVLAAVLLAGARLPAQPGTTASLANSVLANAQATASSITLSAPAFAGATQYKVYRKLRSAPNFPDTPLATLPVSGNTALSYVDNGISPYVLYEYKVARLSASDTAYGYLCSGFQVPASAWAGNADHYMGKVMVLCENTLAASIGPELVQLANDLKAEGWVPVMDDSFHATDSPDAVHAAIVAAYTTDPAHVKAVLLIGHVPVPVTQNDSLVPDAHVVSGRLWPADGYYGDMDGTWTKNTSGTYAGTFNMIRFPSGIELAVGRVDLSDLPAFAATEAQLTAGYLQRDHAFRTAAFTPLDRGLMFDDLAWTDDPDASGGWRAMAPMVGNSVDSDNPESPLPSTGIYQAWTTWHRMPPYLDVNGVTATSTQLVNEGSWLWTFAGGGESLSEAGHAGTTAEYAQPGYLFGGVFNMAFGSYLGRWNTTDNLLRSPLAAGALSNVWSGNPHWYFHNMGMGETLGRSTVQTMNNTGTRYAPQNAWTEADAPNIHMGLMGDPTLRMRMVAPPANLVVANSGGQSNFSWDPSPDPAVDGYYVYAFNAGGVPARLSTVAATGTSWSTAATFPAGTTFMVRAQKLETTPSGSYWNLSAGALATTAAGPMAKLRVKVLLGGPYDAGTGLMNDALRLLPAFPLAEPYSGLGAGLVPMGGGGGETTTGAVLAATGNNAIVDWVLVELRSATDPAQVVEARCGLVQRDGDVVAAGDGASPLQFNAAGPYRISVRHRNHLGCLTAGTLTLAPAATAVVDFTLPATATYGSDARKNVGGTLVLWPGNAAPADHAAKYAGNGNDRDPILVAVGGALAVQVVQAAYAVEDINLDGIIKYTGASNDRDIILVTIGGGVPTAVRLEQLP